jgi:hypothetical protein
MQDQLAQDLCHAVSPPTHGVLFQTKKVLNGNSDVLRPEGVLEPASRTDYLRELAGAVRRLCSDFSPSEHRALPIRSQSLRLLAILGLVQRLTSAVALG